MTGMKAFHKVVMNQIELIFDAFQHFITLDVRVNFTIYNQKELLPFTGALPFQRGSHFENFRFDLCQHLVFTDKVYHQVSHLLAFMLQVVLQLFFLQLHNLFFSPGFFSLKLLLHFMQFFIFLHNCLLLLPFHTYIIPAVNIPDAQQHKDEIEDVGGHTAIPRRKNTERKFIQ